MTNAQGNLPRARVKTSFDAVIIGAGFSGMYMLHSLRDKLDLDVTVFEAGDGVGGTWYWNRYPGARCEAALNSNLLLADHAAINAGFDFRRYAMKPTPAKPRIIMAQVEGSGTAAVRFTPSMPKLRCSPSYV
jgi:cation diffusion facilitator CzcD-associated flavoprotein CzcO